MTSRSIHLALIQSQVFATPAENIQYLSEQIASATTNGANLILLQELHNTPYFCIEENPACFDLAETIPGPSTEVFSKLANEHGVVIVASLFEKRTGGLYHNTAVVFENDGSIAGKYRKMHIPDDPGFYEKYYFTPGDLGFTPIQTSVGKLGVLVCWDQWFPEAARLMALAGAEILLYPTAIGWDPQDTKKEQARQLDAWITIQRSHAIANGIAVASCNRIGSESVADMTSTFWGNSFICGPQGEFLARASSDNNEILSASIAPEKTEQVRRIWPYLRDRRIDAYGDLTRRYIDN
ncbi:MAG: carbon-nitrogen hydrolase [Gammaproteobacteria bacterium]|nr:carbon-nitrogen hydrolase [Gammaproteobacteria bacterium]